MRRKPVLVFLVHAALLLAFFGVLPGSREIYPRAFHAAGNASLGSLGDGLSVRFDWVEPSPRTDGADTRMLGRRAGRLDFRWEALYSAHRRGFWPSASFVALVLATPMSRRRLAAALSLGLLLFHVLFMFQVVAFARVLFGATGPPADASTVSWGRVLPVARAMFDSPITNFSIVFFLWAWLANPARGIDLENLNALLRQLLGPRFAGGPPPAAKAPPPANAEREAAPSDEDAP